MLFSYRKKIHAEMPVIPLHCDIIASIATLILTQCSYRVCSMWSCFVLFYLRWRLSAPMKSRNKKICLLLTFFCFQKWFSWEPRCSQYNIAIVTSQYCSQNSCNFKFNEHMFLPWSELKELIANKTHCQKSWSTKQIPVVEMSILHRQCVSL